MFKKFYFFILILVSFSIQAETLEESMKNQIAKGQYIGTSIGKYNQKGEFWNFGTISKDSKTSPSNKHIYEIGSISKVFTGILLASLHVEGILKLDDKVEKHLVEFKGLPVGSIRLVDLSTHMSGLPRLPKNLGATNIKDPYSKYDSKKLIKYLKTVKNIQKPTKFSWKNYSNLGVGLLGYTLQKVTNKTYDELVKHYITQPLEMNSTAKSISSLDPKKLMKGHNELLEQTPHWTLLAAMDGAGALKSTTEDMVKFIKANINPETTKISKALKLAQKPRYTDGTSGIALGWGVKLENNKLTGIAHNGGTGGFVSNLQISLKKKMGIISLTNTAIDPQCIVQYLILEKACEVKYPRAVETNILKKYLGDFVNKKTGLIFKLTSHFGQLVYEIPGQEIGKTTSVSDTEFSIKGIASIRFKKDHNSFEFEQAGQKLWFIRM